MTEIRQSSFQWARVLARKSANDPNALEFLGRSLGSNVQFRVVSSVFEAFRVSNVFHCQSIKAMAERQGLGGGWKLTDVEVKTSLEIE